MYVFLQALFWPTGLIMTQQLEQYYHLSYTIVSLIFLSPFAGYSLAALCNNSIHMKFGQRGIAIMGPLCHLVAYGVLCAHLPYPVAVVFYVLVGFGNGLEDAAWCAWTGNMINANRIQGILQAFYALGATLSPTIATAMVTKSGLPWYTFYDFMVSTGGDTGHMPTIHAHAHLRSPCRQ